MKKYLYLGLFIFFYSGMGFEHVDIALYHFVDFSNNIHIFRHALFDLATCTSRQFGMRPEIRRHGMPR